MLPRQLIIIGGGLSINEGIEKGLWDKLKGRFTIAINYAFRYCDPTIICFLDQKFQKNHGHEFHNHPLKISRQGADIVDDDTTWLLPVNSKKYMGNESFTKGVYSPFLSGLFAITLGIQLLKGKGEIFLLGYDWRSKIQFENGKKLIINNFHGDTTIPQTFDYNENTKADKMFNNFINAGVKIWNVSPGSGITVFDKIDYDELWDKLDDQLFDQDELRSQVRSLLPVKIINKEIHNANIQEGYPDPILITGCPFSGASVIAGILHNHGITGGNSLDNRNEILYENNDIRENIVKKFLRSINCDPLGQTVLPKTEDMFQLDGNNRRQEVLDIMGNQGLGPNKEWYYTDSKICLDWPIWQRAFPKAKWIIVRRSLDVITDLCLRSPFMKAYSTKEEWLGLLQQYNTKLDEIKKNCETMEVDIQDIIFGDLSQLIRLSTWLSMDYDPEKAQDIIERIL